jgi:hypothetical protein
VKVRNKRCKDCGKVEHHFCKGCTIKHNITYYNKHKEKILDSYKEYRKRIKKLYPWKFTLKGIKDRCNYASRKNYKDYGGKGIKCLITEDELKQLWYDCEAFAMEKPCISRIDHDDHYVYGNCEYVEFLDNVKDRNNRYFGSNKVSV